MRKFVIEITGSNVYINGEPHTKEDNMIKKAILALANEMDYEPTFLFEEMADRLNEILEDAQMHIGNIANLNEYIATLKTLLNEIMEEE